MYKVVFSEEGKKDLKKLDKYTQFIILNWIEKHLNNCENPRQFGKALIADKKGLWRYRIGDYRVLTYIKENVLIILVVRLGHRRDIYE